MPTNKDLKLTTQVLAPEDDVAFKKVCAMYAAIVEKIDNPAIRKQIVSRATALVNKTRDSVILDNSAINEFDVISNLVKLARRQEKELTQTIFKDVKDFALYLNSQGEIVKNAFLKLPHVIERFSAANQSSKCAGGMRRDRPLEKNPYAEDHEEIALPLRAKL